MKILVILFFFNFGVGAQTVVPRVLFFGGYGATVKQTKDWADAVRATPGYLDKYRMRGFTLQGNSGDPAAVVRAEAVRIQRIVDEIDNPQNKRHYILTGFSAGSTTVYEIAKRVKDKARIQIVVLDGWSPIGQGLDPNIPVTCWSAKNGKLKSRNYVGMKGCKNFREIEAPGCQNKECLHCSLINTKSPTLGMNISNFTDLCQSTPTPNLIWLPTPLSTPEASHGTSISAPLAPK